MDLVRRVADTIERHDLLSSGERLVVGLSGGPDSLCLLHILTKLADHLDLHLHVAHLNHLLRGTEAQADAVFVEQLATAWGLSVTIGQRDVAQMAQQRRIAIEEAARQARYAFLAEVAQHVRATKIAVGHNADDQVETVIMHWLRGSGTGGLRGMRFKSWLNKLRLPDLPRGVDALQLIRPLLHTPRSDIERYCAEHGLSPRFDRSNLDTTYFRNRLRHELIPYLETLNPRVREVILRSSILMAADHEFLRAAAQEAWEDIALQESEQAIVFSLAKWRALPLSLQRSTIRHAIHRLRQSLRNINWVHVENAVRLLQSGHTGDEATLPRNLRARVYYDEFIVSDRDFVLPMPHLPSVDEEVTVNIPGTTELEGSRWRLEARHLPAQRLTPEQVSEAHPLQAFLDAAVAGGRLSLRPRQSGDRFWPQGLGDRPTTVNSFMINAKIPREWRDRIPLLTSPSQVLWIPGWRIDERAKLTSDTEQVLALFFEEEDEGRQ